MRKENGDHSTWTFPQLFEWSPFGNVGECGALRPVEVGRQLF